jgi:hypothetical protein
MTSDYAAQQQPGSGYAAAQNPAPLYAKQGGKAAPAKAKAPSGKSPGKGGEVTILGRYLWQPPISGEEEVQYFLDHKWHPSFEDYVAITGVRPKTSPGNFIHLMGMIAGYKPKSIKRLNFWTHSNKTEMGIMGDVVRGNVHFTEWIDEFKISKYAAEGLSFDVGKQHFTLDDVRDKFADDAIFVLYGCEIAADPTGLLTSIKDLLQVSVIGFRTEQMYCPPTQQPGSKTFNRKGEKVGVRKSGFSCEKDSTSNWRSLINDPNAVKVNK